MRLKLMKLFKMDEFEDLFLNITKGQSSFDNGVV